MLEWVPAGLNTGALSGAKASSSRTRDNLGRFGSRYIASSSIVISSIVSLLVGSFNVFLITLIVRREY
jgi:hypothetical protein